MRFAPGLWIGLMTPPLRKHSPPPALGWYVPARHSGFALPAARAEGDGVGRVSAACTRGEDKHASAL
eukprot:SAG22_NODE_1008_length_6054_cov_11.023678_7_plen_67_part_00